MAGRYDDRLLAMWRRALPTDAFERMRRLELVLTSDGKVRADRLHGPVPAENLDPIPPELVEIDDPDVFGSVNELRAYLATLVATYGPTNATYVTQTPNATLTNEQALSALATGLLKVTTATGVLSTAVANTDYLPVANPTVTGNATLGNDDADTAIVQGHLRHKGASPSIAVGTALGTGGSVGAVITYGTDQFGRLTLTAGTTSLTTGTAATITFTVARPDTNLSIVLFPQNTAAGANAVQVRATAASTTTWTITFAVAPTSGTVYSWHYAIVETA